MTFARGNAMNLCEFGDCEMTPIDSFLLRVGIDSLPEDPWARLLALHRAIPLTVPYENLEILEGRTISLDPAALHHKVVQRRRGGYCYELNGLFAEVLEALGFRVERLLARVWTNGHPAPPLTHMVLRVTVGQEAFLCDVGFGVGTLREPVPWRLDEVVRQDPDCVRLIAAECGETMLQGWVADRWKDLYSIIGWPLRPQDFLPANHYSSTHPDSFFTQAPMAALNTPGGRVTLRGRTFRRVTPEGTSELELDSFDELMEVVSTEFGLAGLDTDALRQRLAPLFR